MKESELRKWHRTMGIVLAFFIVLQAGSGILLSLGEVHDPASHADPTQGGRVESQRDHGGDREDELGDLHEFIHHGAGGLGAVYRVVLGMGLLGMALSGAFIYLKIRARMPKKG
jgi:hypothetical protein